MQDYDNMDIIVSASWLKEHLEDPNIRILDMRSPMAYRISHIPNAQLVRYENIVKVQAGFPFLMIPSREDAERAFGEMGIDNDKTVVVYGEAEEPQAARVFWTLDFYGAKVKMLDTAFRAWAQQGLPITKDLPQIQQTKFTASPAFEKQADAHYLMSNLTKQDVTVADTRSPEEYNGTMGTGLRQGHIPGAVNIPWSECIGSQGKIFQPASELASVIKTHGISKSKEIVTYCFVGERAAHTYVALRLLGFTNVRLYDRSFAEWSGNTNLPVE
ncbi:MAG: sulfurtransferase [Candidatus Bathyarchaeia archaeon]